MLCFINNRIKGNSSAYPLKGNYEWKHDGNQLHGLQAWKLLFEKSWPPIHKHLGVIYHVWTDSISTLNTNRSEIWPSQKILVTN